MYFKPLTNDKTTTTTIRKAILSINNMLDERTAAAFCFSNKTNKHTNI